MGPGTLVAAAIGASAAGLAWRKAVLARSHRDVGGFALGSAVAAAMVLLTISLLVAPGIWIDAYRAVMGGYGGD